MARVVTARDKVECCYSSDRYYTVPISRQQCLILLIEHMNNHDKIVTQFFVAPQMI